MAQKAALFYFIPNWFDTSCSIVKSTTLPTGTASFTVLARALDARLEHPLGNDSVRTHAFTHN
jgi:hypothetical protein